MCRERTAELQGGERPSLSDSEKPQNLVVRKVEFHTMFFELSSG